MIDEEKDIIYVISNYLNLKKMGKNYVTLCPFHNEKTASFTVTEEQQFFYCFGCKIGGNAETFLKLCKNKNISKKEYLSKKEIYKKKKYIIFNKENNIIWYKKLVENSILEIKNNHIGLNYCLKRNVNINTIKLFSIGFLTNNINNDFFQKNKKNKTLNMFLNRIIFPIKNEKGIILGLGGRIIGNSIKQKYLNTENTTLFEKKKIIFGLYECLKYSKNFQNFLILVEGYFDVLTLFSNGITNTISTLGTTISIEQLNIIFKYTNELFFCYDGDAAGTSSSLKNIAKIINICKLKKKKIKNIRLPNKTDPDSFITSNGVKNFKKLITDTPYII